MSENKNRDNHADREPGKGAGGQHENPSTEKSVNQQEASQAAAGGESDDAPGGSGMSRRQALKYIGIGAGAWWLAVPLAVTVTRGACAYLRTKHQKSKMYALWSPAVA